MAKLSEKALNEAKSLFIKAQYVKKVWVTNKDYTFSLKQYSEMIDPIFKSVDTTKPAVIIGKERKDGGVFEKMEIPLKKGSSVEFELSYEHEFEEGDEIKIDSLQFCIEECLDKKHPYVTGKVI